MLHALDRVAPRVVSRPALAAAIWRLDAAEHDLSTISTMVRNVRMRLGTRVRMLEVRLASAAPEVVAAVRGYDLRLAPFELHRVLLQPLGGAQVAAPHRLWKGWVDGLNVTTPLPGEEGAITLTVASAARGLTRALSGKWSDAAMRLRGDDRAFRYADVSGSVPVWWAENKYSPTPAAGAPGESAGGGFGFKRRSERL